MADKKFKKLQIGPAVSYVDAKLGIKIDDQEVGGSGKVWKELKITQELIDSLENMGMADFELEEPYDPSNFENDYVRAVMDIEGEYIGSLVAAIEPLHRLYVDFVHVGDWCNESVQREFIAASQQYGFQHQNYNMGILYAKADNVDFVALDTNGLDDLKDEFGEVQLAWDITQVSPLTGWTETEDTPLPYAIEANALRAGYTMDGEYRLCYYNFETQKYYYTTKTTGSGHTVYVRGSNLGYNQELTAEVLPDFVKEVSTGHEPIMIKENPMNEYNIIYIADVTRQPWDVLESNPGVDPGSGEQEETQYGKQYAISIHGKNTKVSYLMVFEDGAMSVVNDTSHQITQWAPVTAEEVYHLTWDATANRFSLGSALTDAEKQTLFSTGIEFDSVGGAQEVRMITNDGEIAQVVWSARVVGASSDCLQYVFSADEEFAPPERRQKGTFIARPLGFALTSYTSFNDELQQYVTHKEGEYVWECVVGTLGTLQILVPLPEDEEELTTCTIRIVDSSGSGSGSSTPSTPSMETKYLYRHSFRIVGADQDNNKVAVSFTAVNCQSANTSTSHDILNYLVNSDTSSGWRLAAGGVYYQGTTRYDVIAVTNVYTDTETGTTTIGGTSLYGECINSAGEASIKVIASLSDCDDIECSDDQVNLGSIIE